MNLLRLKERLIQAFLIAVPLIHIHGRSDRIAQEDYFKYLGMCLVTAFCGSLWLSLFMCLNVFLFVYHGESIGLSQVLNVFIGLCIFMVSKAFFKNHGISVLRAPIIILTFLTIIWMIFQAFGVDPMFVSQDAAGRINEANPQLIGIYGIKMANGTFLVLSSIFLCTTPIASLALAVPIFISSSSSVALAYAAWLGFWSYFKLRRFFWLILAGMILAGSAFAIYDHKTDPKTFISRFPVWHSCIRYALLYPLGYGPDSYRKLHKHKDFLFAGDGDYNHAIIRPKGNETDFLYYSPTSNMDRVRDLTMKALESGTLPGNEENHWDNPHNGFLNVLFQYGILGIIILIGLVREIVLRFKNVMKDDELIIITGCLMAFAITSLTHFPLELARVGCLFPILLGAFYAKTRTV